MAMSEHEIHDIEVFGPDGYADLDYDRETGEVFAPAEEVRGNDGNRTGWSDALEVPALSLSPDEAQALSFDAKQKYALALTSYITLLTTQRKAIAEEVAEYHANKEYLALGNRTRSSMTIVQRKTWDQEVLNLMPTQRQLARTAHLSAEYSHVIQSLVRVASVVQTCIRAEMAEGNLTP